MRHFILLLVLLHLHSITTTFSPDTSDFDAYGLKIAANDVLFAQAKNQAKTFLVQFAPYNFTRGSLQCNIDFADQSHYVYSVAVGSKQSLAVKPYFYYTGEVLALGPRSTDGSDQNGTFIAVMSSRDPADIASSLASKQPIRCEQLQPEAIQHLSSYGHQEFFVIAVEPYGQYAIGLATDFVFRYQPYPLPLFTSQPSSTVWPNNATFQPCATDATTSFTIVAGFVKNSGHSRVRAAPTVYLLWNSNLTVLSTWTFTATNNTWQARLAYPNVDSWSNGLTMSVKINGDDPTRILVGMPFLNTVFLFQVSNDGTNLTMVSFKSKGVFVGFGKGVTWLSSTQAAILYSAYSCDSVTWYSSQVYVYTWLNDTTLPSSPTAVIPNAQQPLPSTINAKFIRLISTPSTVAILDQAGGAILITSESPGLVRFDRHHELSGRCSHASRQPHGSLCRWYVQSRSWYPSLHSLLRWYSQSRHCSCYSLHRLFSRLFLPVGSGVRNGEGVHRVCVASSGLSSITRLDRVRRSSHRQYGIVRQDIALSARLTHVLDVDPVVHCSGDLTRHGLAQLLRPRAEVFSVANDGEERVSPH